mgnify:CR=1 FL=1
MMAKNKIGISLRVVKASNYDENRDAYSDWIEESQVTESTHGDVYVSTSLDNKDAIGVMKYMVLQTWDFL